MRIHIGHHFFGSGNIGDDWMLAGFLKVLATSGANVRLTCCTPHDREAMNLRFPEVEWLEYGIEHRRRAIEASNAWLGLGDTPFQADTGQWFLEHLEADFEICECFKVKAFFLGVGVESTEAAASPRTASLIRRARRIWARDPRSAEAIQAASDSESKVVLGSDLAHLYFASLPARGKTVAAGPLGMVVNVERAELLNAARIESFLSRNPPGRVRWIAQEVRDLATSEVRLWNGFSADVRSRLTFSAPDYHAGSVASLIGPYLNLSSLLSSRYHSALAGAWLGIPISVFARNNKLRGVIEDLGAAECPGLIEEEQLAEGFLRARAVPSPVLDRLAEIARRSCLEFLDGVG